MALVRVIVCLLGLVVLCHSECSFQELQVTDMNNPPKGCVDQDGTSHDFDSEWVRDCNKCFCSRDGLSCCSMLPSQVEFDTPEDCELAVDKQTCSYKIVMKSDKTKVCSPA